MPGSVENINVPAWKVTGTYWVITRAENDSIVNIFFINGEVVSPYEVHVGDNLSEMFQAWIDNSLTLPILDVHIRVDKSIFEYSLDSHVDDVDLDWLDQNFADLVALLKGVGITNLGINLFVDAKIILDDLEDVFLYYLQNNKATRTYLESRMDWLETEGHITNPQKVAFWANIDAQL